MSDQWPPFHCIIEHGVTVSFESDRLNKDEVEMVTGGQLNHVSVFVHRFAKADE